MSLNFRLVFTFLINCEIPFSMWKTKTNILVIQESDTFIVMAHWFIRNYKIPCPVLSHCYLFCALDKHRSGLTEDYLSYFSCSQIVVEVYGNRLWLMDSWHPADTSCAPGSSMLMSSLWYSFILAHIHKVSHKVFLCGRTLEWKDFVELNLIIVLLDFMSSQNIWGAFS